MDPIGKEKLSFIAAFGAGIALTATVTGIYNKIKSSNSKHRQCDSLTAKLDLLNETIEQLRKDVEEIKIASIRGSPFSLQPIDVDTLEADLEGTEGVHQQLIQRLNNHHPLSYHHPHHHHYHHHRPNRNHEDRLQEGKFDLNSADPYTSSSENEEFFDFYDSDNNQSGIIKATKDYDDEDVATAGDDEEEMSTKNINVNSVSNEPIKSTELSQDTYFQSIDSLIDDPKADIQSLYDKLSEMETKFGVNAQIMWRKAKVCHLLGSAEEKKGNKEKKKEYAFEKLDCARKALELDDKCVESHKWYAIAIGSITDYVGTKEKIENGYEFKKHLDYALALKPTDATLHHLLGRWASEVSNLSWLERKLASSLFAQLPETTADEALQSLLKAYEIKPEWKQNVYFICKTLISLKRNKEAVEWISKGLNCKIDDDDDQITHDKLLSLKAKYSK